MEITANKIYFTIKDLENRREEFGNLLATNNELSDIAYTEIMECVNDITDLISTLNNIKRYF